MASLTIYKSLWGYSDIQSVLRPLWGAAEGYDALDGETAMEGGGDAMISSTMSSTYIECFPRDNKWAHVVSNTARPEARKDIFNAQSRLIANWENETCDRWLFIEAAVYVGDGIHPSLRQKLWPLLAGVERQEREYNALLKQPLSEDIMEQIDRDIGRTFFDAALFSSSGGLGQKCLQRLLRAYAVKDASVGYCQGLNFIAATLLNGTYFDEALSFALLCAIMEKTKSMFSHNLAGSKVCLELCDELIQRRLPALHDHFKAEGVDACFFALRWFGTLFCVEPDPFRSRMLDAMFAGDFRMYKPGDPPPWEHLTGKRSLSSMNLTEDPFPEDLASVDDDDFVVLNPASAVTAACRPTVLGGFSLVPAFRVIIAILALSEEELLQLPFNDVLPRLKDVPHAHDLRMLMERAARVDIEEDLVDRINSLQ